MTTEKGKKQQQPNVQLILFVIGVHFLFYLLIICNLTKAISHAHFTLTALRLI